MPFISTIPEDEATGDVAAMYEADREAFGHLPNFTRAFSARPEVYAAWRALNGAVRSGMELRRYELATLAAARRLGSSYCALAHGKVLLDRALLDEDELQAVVADHRTAGLDEVEVAVMDLADKVAADARSVTAEDVARLRDLGLSDRDVFDVVAAAAARCFFSTVLDALGVAPDARFGALAPGVRDALTVGRAIAEA